MVSGDQLIPLVNTSYDSEGRLQKLLADFPDLIAGGQVDPDKPRRWILVGREVGVPDKEGGGGRWSLDHLFLDQDGVPTVVEVKRSTDTRIRREVVGQMLDYGANGIQHWPIDALRSRFESSHDRPEEAINVHTDGFLTYDEFWELVESNLRSRRIRLVWVADVIPTELQTIIEYLNEELKHGEALGVEIRQYVGEGIQTLVPRVVGLSATQRVEKRESANYVENLERSSTDTRRVAELFIGLGMTEDFETAPTKTALKLQFAGGGTAALLYPQWDRVEFYLGSIADSGLVAEATDLQRLFSAIAGEAVTDRNPYFSTSALVSSWTRFVEEVLPRYSDARARAKRLSEGEASA